MEYVISVNGGKDSTAVLLDTLDKVPKEKIKPVFMDTKWETDEVYYYLDYLEYKLDIKIIRIESEGMVKLSKRKRMMPNRFMRFCTENLKIRPFQEWLKKEYVDKNIEFCVVQGVRREESKARENTPVYNIIKSIIKGPKFDILNLYPIAYWKTEDVFDFIKLKGLEPNPLYKVGYSRVGCMPCIYANKWELENLPDKYKDRLRELEGTMSELLDKNVKFFAKDREKHIKQELLFKSNIEYPTCDVCGNSMFIENFCNICYNNNQSSKIEL